MLANVSRLINSHTSNTNHQSESCRSHLNHTHFKTRSHKTNIKSN